MNDERDMIIFVVQN